MEAIILGKSIYLTTFRENRFFTLHQILNFAIISTTIGFAIYISGSRECLIIGQKKKTIFLLYLMLLFMWIVYFLVMGNKHMLFSAIIAGVLFYIANIGNKIEKKLIIIGAFAGIILYSIDTLRGTSLSEIIYAINIKELIFSSPSLFLSNEMMASHFSMYGVLKYNVPFVWGYSIVSLIASIVPRIFWMSRPTDIYQHYASSVGAAEGQGYAISHATGWYLNFGILGIILGAIVWGMVWAWCFNKYSKYNKNAKLLSNAFNMLLPWLFVANIPELIRGGIEGYKGLIIGILVPAGIIIICIKNFKIKLYSSITGSRKSQISPIISSNSG
jgi:hypothetical protein